MVLKFRPTHRYGEQLLQARQDSAGRTSYFDAITGVRAATAGKEIEAIVGPEVDALMEGRMPTEEGAPEPPNVLAFAAFAVAITAYMQPGGHHESGGYSARRSGEGLVILSVPAGDGGHWRYEVRLPEYIPVDATLITPESAE